MVQSVQVFQQQALIESLQVLDAKPALFLGQAGLFPSSFSVSFFFHSNLLLDPITQI